jgi:DNA-binding CsgD family transcriptional regulator/tetratricopeptide (TPR) repeat protein
MVDMTDSRLRRLPAFVWENLGETGRVSVVTGVSNSGIRDVVDDVCRLAADDGAAVLRRTAAWLESELPFALFCQLISGLDLPRELAGSAHELIESSLSSGDGLVAEYRGLRAIQGLCDLLMAGASGRRLLVVVDDAQFIDVWSLRCLLSLVPRLRSGGTGLVVSGLPPLGATDPHWLSELLRAPGTRSFQVSPLTEHDIEELAYGLGLRPTVGQLRRWHQIGGGNLALTRGLLEDRQLALELGAAGEPPVVGGHYRQAYTGCVRQDLQLVVDVVRVVAVLGATPVALLGRILDARPEQMTEVLDRATASGLLVGMDFRHEAARDVVLSALPPGLAAELHLRAATLLHGDGAPSAVVARHLLTAEYAKEPWTWDVLRTAAYQLRAEGGPEVAAACLRLVCASGAEPRVRSHALAELAATEWSMDPQRAEHHLNALTDAARRGEMDMRHIAIVVRLLIWHGYIRQAREIVANLDEAAATDPDAYASLQLISQLVRLYCPDLLDGVESLSRAAARIVPPEEVDVSVGLRMRAHSALHQVVTGGSSAEAVASAEHVLRTIRPGDVPMDYAVAGLNTLLYAERADLTATFCDAFLADGNMPNQPVWMAMLAVIRAEAALNLGRLQEAVRYVDLALETLPEPGWGMAIGLIRGIQLTVLPLVGRYDEAREQLRRPIPEMMMQTWYGLRYRWGRGNYYLSAGLPEAALDDFLACGRLAERWQMDRPGLLPWRAGVAAALMRLGPPEQARELLIEQLALLGDARSRMTGVTLRLLAGTVQAPQQPGLLRMAAEQLQRSGDRYELAVALAEMAQTHRRLRDPNRARLFTRKAWQVAVECGAKRLAAQLAQVVSGSVKHADISVAKAAATAAEAPSLPDPAVPGPDRDAAARLTSAEYRVGVLAAYGLTNREIAKRLFVTTSTVEQHLTRIYRKLKIGHRSHLAAHDWDFSSIEAG